jgi:hypothetical protein
MLFLPRRLRIACFFLTSLWQVGVILSANYTFLNYLVLALGFLLLDDKYIGPLLREKFKPTPVGTVHTDDGLPARLRKQRHTLGVAATTVVLCWIFYATTVQMIWILWPRVPFPAAPVRVLEPFRIANRYGLFATMTRGRYEIEFQGSNDGENWVAYPFRYKPQALNEAPGIYAPYQPRFDWNLWFASLGTWRDNMFVVSTEERLLENEADALTLFRGNPFSNAPPKQVRVVLWQYWFTSLAEKRATGNWWKKAYLGTYAPTLVVDVDGKVKVAEWPTIRGPKE